MAALIQNRHNQHHGKDGKFASGSGGGAGGVRQSLADAKNIEELNTTATAGAKAITGREIKFDMQGSDLDIAKEHVEGIMRGLERFPDAGLVGVHTYGPDRPLANAPHQKDWAGVTRSHGVVADGKFVMQSHIYFNTGFEHGELQADLRESAKSGYLVAGTHMGTALHEYGHVVTQSRGTKRDVYDHAVAKADAAGAQPRHFITRHVSGYAATDMGEFSAEIFADVMVHGVDASELSKSAFAVIENAGS